VSRQCAHRWLARFDVDGEAGLADRSSRPKSSPRRTPAVVERRVLAERDTSRRGPDWIAAELGCRRGQRPESCAGMAACRTHQKLADGGRTRARRR
jgi:leucine-zipper of insertion element IS481